MEQHEQNTSFEFDIIIFFIYFAGKLNTRGQMLRTQIIIPLVVLLYGLLPAQHSKAPFRILTEEVRQAQRSGEQALLQKAFSKALRYFKKALKNDPAFLPALRGTGACYELTGDYGKAIKNYEKIIEINPRFSRTIYFDCANVHYKAGDYSRALELFAQFDSLKLVDLENFSFKGLPEQKTESDYFQKLPQKIHACQVALDSIQFWNIPELTNLGANINTPADEYFPFLSNDLRKIYYTSRKNPSSDENLFFSAKHEGRWRRGQAVGNGFNTKENEGMVSLVRDGNRIYFTACQRQEVKGACDIWEANLTEKGFASANPLAGKANSGDWESQASISCDGSALYFASNREGGQGGTDIWVSRKLPGGIWGEPQNPGAEINTPCDEEGPFITNDGKVLYFSSNGHPGMGEQDIFMSRKMDSGAWGKPVNLGVPVNSSYRELGFFLSADEKTGYFASDRPEGFGGMDIYQFELPEQLLSDPITYLEGFVKDSILKTPVQTTLLFEKHPPVQTDSEGRFFLCLPAGEPLKFEIKAKDYRPCRGEILAPKWDNKTFFQKEFLLDPVFRLPAYTGKLDTAATPFFPSPSPHFMEKNHLVLFEFDHSELRPENKRSLDNFLEEEVYGKPVHEISIVGYADDIGKDSYNLVLSEKRAKAIGVYLKEKGVRVDKIFIEGKGKTDDGKPKWENRKVELLVQLEDGGG